VKKLQLDFELAVALLSIILCYHQVGFSFPCCGMVGLAGPVWYASAWNNTPEKVSALYHAILNHTMPSS